MKPWKKSHGLITATFTPMRDDGSVNLSMIAPYIDHLNAQGITQVYVNGTAAECQSLSVSERKAIALTWMREGRDKLSKIIIQCGAGNLVDTQELASHAQSIRADCVAVVAPTYYKPTDTASVVRYCAEVAKVCANTPFMYYHYPGITGIDNVRATDFLEEAGKVIPNLIGVKFTSTDLYDAGQALRVDNGKYDVIIGGETILLGALAMGLTSGIGIAFSLVGRPCNRILDAWKRGDLDAARRDQYKLQDFWAALHTPGDKHAMIRSFKATMGILGLHFGPTRLPIRTATDEEKDDIRRALDRLNYNEWAGM